MTVQNETARRRSIGFLNWAHFLDHYVILIFPTVVIGLKAVYGRSYGDLLVLSTAAFTAFGLFALPAGWLADTWSRRNMIAIYFFGTGICCVLVGLSDSFETLAIALFGVGLFAAIYHPVGTPMVVDAAVTRGRTMAFNGICGNIGVSIASGCTAVIASPPPSSPPRSAGSMRSSSQPSCSSCPASPISNSCPTPAAAWCRRRIRT